MLCLACLTTACTTDSEQRLTSQLFTKTYRDIHEVYLFPTEASDLALGGLGNLASIDPRIAVAKDDNQITVSVAGELIRSFAAPRSADAAGWGKAIAATMKTTSAASVALQDAGVEELRDAVLQGMFNQLDDLSYYSVAFDPDQAEPEMELQEASIGVTIEPDFNGPRISFIGDDTPARAGGMRRGDIIRRIDGWPTKGLTLGEVYRALTGPEDSSVRLTIQRGDEPSIRPVTLVRRIVELETVNYAAQSNAAYFQIRNFAPGTAATLRRKIREAKQDLREGLKGVVVDLRNNYGGRLREGVSVADVFLASGLIAKTRGRHPDSHQNFTADLKVLADGMPLVFLIDGRSAGASELVAAALQDADRAVIIGSASAGNGSVQTVLRLPNNGWTRLTWALFQAPSGYSWLGRGVMPNICTTKYASDAEEVLNRLRRGLLPIAKPVRQRPVDSRNTAQIEALLTHCPPSEVENDIDLQVALQLLNNASLYARAIDGPGS